MYANIGLDSAAGLARVWFAAGGLAAQEQPAFLAAAIVHLQRSTRPDQAHGQGNTVAANNYVAWLNHGETQIVGMESWQEGALFWLKSVLGAETNASLDRQNVARAHARNINFP